MKILFWLLIAADALAWMLVFVLGLAAATSTRQSGFAVAMSLPFLVPALIIIGAVALFLKSPNALGRSVALLIAASPALILIWMRGSAQLEMAQNTNDAGEVAYFKKGTLRDIATAITSDDTATVAKLLPTVDVNSTGFMEVTLLMLAIRHLEHSPKQLTNLRAILAAGADPNLKGQSELPLYVAIQQGEHSGAEPVLMLLKAGAKPNTKDQFGSPAWFMATGMTVPPEVLATLLDNGADIKITDKHGKSAILDAAITGNWKAVLVLLERGADYKTGRSLQGETIEQLAQTATTRTWGDTTGAAAVVTHLKNK